jgi:SAM-dependent methyltransferase
MDSQPSLASRQSQFEEKSRAIEVMHRAARVIKERGLLHFARRVFRKVFLAGWYLLLFPFYRTVAGLRSFSFQGKRFRYIYRFDTWYNERVVEIPLVWDMICSEKYKNILEIGNVLSHYFAVKHDILDKYEKASGVVNEDIISYHPAKKYDLIVSISTLEHVGYDESPRDTSKIFSAMENIRSLLAPGGIAVITWALGYNIELDGHLFQGRLPLDAMYFFKRESLHRWTAVDEEQIQREDIRYNAPWFDGTYLVVALMKRDSHTPSNEGLRN